MPAAIPYYTIEDLERFPADGNRYELLDGVLLVTPSAEQPHQLIAGDLLGTFRAALGTAARVAGPGVVMKGDKTQLEPDMLVYPSKWSRKAKWSVVTEHWLAVEIYSPSSRVYDRDFKRDAYLRLGIREVWLVDIDAEQVEVCTLSGSRVERERVEWAAPDGIHHVVVDLRELFRD